jgi:WD40 repeat protein
MADPVLVWRSREEHASQIRSLDISPNHALIVTGANDSKVKLWSAETGSLEATADAPSGCWVTVAAFSPDSTRVLAAGDASCA